MTPVSSHDAKVVAAHLLEGNRHRPDYRGAPSVAFTLPPIAAVGSEAAARAARLKFRVNRQKVPDWYTARRVAETVYGYKTRIEEGSQRVLGAHLVGPHGDEVINLFALAIRHDLIAEDLKQTIFAHPAGASDIGSILQLRGEISVIADSTITCPGCGTAKTERCQSTPASISMNAPAAAPCFAPSRVTAASSAPTAQSLVHPSSRVTHRRAARVS